MVDDNKSEEDKDVELKVDPRQVFIDEFEVLMKKHNISKYVTYVNIGDEPVILHRPNDLVEITRVLKMAHSQFYHRLMVEIGEASPQ